jgi:HEAT repeat protein
VIVEEGPATNASRPSGAHRVLKALQDPSVLAPAAHDLLHGQPPSRQASGLLLAAGVGGAYVLYGARTKSAPDEEVRTRFVAMMREIGTQAFPVLRAALEKLEGRDEDAPALLVDVLRGIPPIRDDATGEVVSRFLTCKAPEIRGVATLALVQCWGERAQALLVGLLKDEDESVRIAAIAGIRKIGRVDETVVRRLGAMLQPSHRMSTALKTEAAIAYRSAAVAGRPTAIAILTRLVATSPASGPREEALLVEMARSLLLLGAREGGAVVTERASRQREPLRGRLLELMSSAGQGVRG